jgi:type IV pilus assembly protein PilA
VIPIAAIMTAIAIPAYQNYLVRAQVAEGVTLSYTARDAVTQYIASHGAMPEDNAAAGMSRPDQITGKYVSSVAVRDGQVVVTFGDSAEPPIRGEHLVMVPQGDTSALHWQCRSPDIQVKYLPQSCRE